MKTRSRAALVIAAVAAGMVACTHLTDFGRFRFVSDMSANEHDLAGDDLAGDDLAGEADSGGLDLTFVNTDGGVVTPSNGFSCEGQKSLGDIALAKVSMISTSANPPTLTSPTMSLVGFLQGSTAVFCVRTLSIPSGATLTVSGIHSLVVVAADWIDIEGTLSSEGVDGEQGGTGGGSGGAGGADGYNGAEGNGSSAGFQNGGGGGTYSSISDSGSGGGGGAGGIANGGAGGIGSMPTALGGVPGGEVTAGSFVGGAAGGGAGTVGVSAVNGGGGGGGGGAIQLTVLGGAGFITIGANAVVDLSGGGGGGGVYLTSTPQDSDVASGGGGGGAGGLFWVEAATVNLHPYTPSQTGCITVVGGGGGNAGATGNGSNNGGARRPGGCPFLSMAPNESGPGAGGAGQSSALLPGSGVNGATTPMIAGGGGGGGAAGVVVVRSGNTLAPSTTLDIVPAASLSRGSL
jgi:hypothetical protein